MTSLTRVVRAVRDGKEARGWQEIRSSDRSVMVELGGTASVDCVYVLRYCWKSRCCSYSVVDEAIPVFSGHAWVLPPRLLLDQIRCEMTLLEACPQKACLARDAWLWKVVEVIANWKRCA